MMSEAGEVGNHSSQDAEQEKTRIHPINSVFKLSHSLRFRLLTEVQLRLRFKSGVSPPGTRA